MQFLVKTSARECGVYNPVVCTITFVKNDKTAAKIYDTEIANLEQRISTIRERTLTTQEVQGFRELYKTIGSKVVPAGERLLKSCEKKGFPRYGNLVDAYNIIALETVSPFGMHDARKLIASQCNLIFKRAEGNEKITPSFTDDECTIPAGDFTYGIEQDGKFVPFAWLGKKDVDSKDLQIQDDTTTLLFTAIGNKYTSLERNRQLCQEVFAKILLSCPDAKLTIFEPTFIQ